MAVVKEVGGLWVCEYCGLKYESRELAESCEAWCRRHRSCNLEIAKHAVGRPLRRLVWK
ncbi:hypothetical protein IG193_00755 [Infirmifilum lucidum]|uniref:Uncharacterized protein n=1 Tax=Infirmifilum lucidum TaxID=2776706 RepID=A0A7L9FGU4_9CREN|nr:hypothetical protein [Infirmifilum lucidum]QOJ79030.1 hypothetical protein IG193_00755 [Infirmifilum lucidum]